MSDLQKLFTKVTGLTFSVDKIPAEKLAWYIPDGAMLDNNDSEKLKVTSEFMESAGIDMSEKVTSIIESTLNNEDPKVKPEGDGWKKVVDVEAVEEVIEKWILNGTEYNSDPTFESLESFEVISDESSWNASFANGILKLYYEKNPSEDVWNNNESRACNFNDKVYTAKVYTDASGEGDFEEKQFKALWLSDEVQQIIEIGGDANVYYIPMFYDVPAQLFEMFCNAPGGYAAKAADLTDSSAHYIKIVSAAFGGEGVGPAYAGWIANGAQIPWICIDFTESDPGVKVIFKYEGKSDVYPWNDNLFGNGEGHKAWGIASLPQEFGEGTTDVSKLQIVFEHQGVEHIEPVEGVEEQYHWERKVVK